MKISILTLFPDYFNSVLESSMLRRATDQAIVEYNLINIRDFAVDKHSTTDDRPYGGGAGMVLKVEPIDRALASLDVKKGGGTIDHRTAIVLTSAKGALFTQSSAQTFAQLNHFVLICGHYEGVDQRVIDHLIDREVRIGDYVLTGGEPAAAVIIDATVRLLPGVLGNKQSLERESHSSPGFLAHPQYTQPREYKGWSVPEVLLGGNHAEIKTWRAENSSKNSN